MGWKDLLGGGDDLRVLPWTGGRDLLSEGRRWSIEGKLPTHHGWYTFRMSRRSATLGSKFDEEIAKPRDEVPPGSLYHIVKGFLVGDRLVRDDASSIPALEDLMEKTERVFIIEAGLDKFQRVEAGRTSEDGPLIYCGIDMPLGPEDEVKNAFLDRKDSISHVKEVTPGLEAAFRIETWRRAETERARAEAEAARAAEEARMAEEERRAHLFERVGDGKARRELAVLDFGEAARCALAVGNAELLDHRDSTLAGEKVVRFRFGERRFECTCDARTLRIIDSGICLVDHRTNIKGDTFFTLESLPGVIAEAEAKRKLVIFRHADPEDRYGEDEDDDY